MTPESAEFVMGSSGGDALPPRRRKQYGLRGILYGVSAYGYPAGAIVGVQTPLPTDPPVNPDQFGPTDGSSPDSAGSTAGGADSSGGGATS